MPQRLFEPASPCCDFLDMDESSNLEFREFLEKADLGCLFDDLMKIGAEDPESLTNPLIFGGDEQDQQKFVEKSVDYFDSATFVFFNRLYLFFRRDCYT